MPWKSLLVCNIHTKISPSNETGACNSSWSHKLESNTKLSDTKWLKYTLLRAGENHGWLKPGLKPCYCYKAKSDTGFNVPNHADRCHWITNTCRDGPECLWTCWMLMLSYFPVEYEACRLTIVLSQSTMWWWLRKISDFGSIWCGLVKRLLF